MRHSHRASRALSAALIIAVAVPAGLSAQATTDLPANVRITDVRLSASMERLLQGSASARTVVADLAASGLVVIIGSNDVAASSSSGHAGALAQTRAGQTPIASVMLDVAADAAETIERAFIVIDVDGMARRLEPVSPERAAHLLEQDLLATLAHEFVAHVGSIARTRRLADFCDDPTPASQSIDPLGCSIRVENRVRRELNRELELRGADRLPERRSYALDVMNFARTER